MRRGERDRARCAHVSSSQGETIPCRLQRRVGNGKIRLGFFGGPLTARAVARELPRALGSLGRHLLAPRGLRHGTLGLDAHIAFGRRQRHQRQDDLSLLDVRADRRHATVAPSVPATGAVTVICAPPADTISPPTLRVLAIVRLPASRFDA